MSGLFESGINPTGWGLTEWLIVGAGALLLSGGGKRIFGSGTSRARRNPAKRKNESGEMGFWRGGRFHPIRRSDDYDPGAVGERWQWKPRYAKKTKKGKR